MQFKNNGKKSRDFLSIPREEIHVPLQQFSNTTPKINIFSRKCTTNVQTPRPGAPRSIPTRADTILSLKTSNLTISVISTRHTSLQVLNLTRWINVFYKEILTAITQQRSEDI